MKMKRRLRINAKGKKLYKFINMLHESGIFCGRQYCKGDVFRGDILRRDLKTVSALAKECGVELKAAEYESLGAKLFLYRKRLGLLLGAAAAAAAVLWSSQTIAVIDIQGNSAVSDAVILAALDELDVREGAFLPCTDLRSCEEKLPLLVEDIAWAGIRRSGNRIEIQIREAEPKPPMLRTRIPANIFASRDAEITDVCVQSGQLLHVVGDYVPKGTMLVSAVREFDNGCLSVYHAMGEIRGKYSETFSFSGTFRSEELSPTGNVSKERYLKLFGLKIPLFFGKSDYESSSKEVTEKPLVLFGRELPIGTELRTVTETAPTVREYTAEELEQKLMERVYLCEKNFLSGDTEILSRDIKTTKSDDTMTLEVTYELEGVISEGRDLFVK
ncbi:MAG: sporulation protein YqfD [Ruminococcus sp.]|nr:sporulation protein YqfD [Ruminococcus sp.]